MTVTVPENRKDRAEAEEVGREVGAGGRQTGKFGTRF